MTERRRWILLPLGALAAVLIVLVVLFDWNWLKGLLEDQAAAALGREVEVGDLVVDLSTTPTITLQRVRIANAEWGSRPDMLTVERAAFALDLWRLLDGEIALPFVHVDRPDLLLETSGDGRANWEFGEQDEPEAPPALPTIRDLEIANAAVRYHEPDRSTDLVAALESVDGAMTSSGIEVNATGTLDGEPLSVRVAGASVDQLEEPAKRFPFELEGRLGATRLAATGSAEQLLQARGLSVDIVVASQDPGTLLPLAGRERRELGPLDLTVSLTRQDETWALRQIDLQLGETDLRGSLAIARKSDEPLITADLASDQVRVEDLRPLLPGNGGQASGGGPEAPIDGAIADAKAALADDRPDANGRGFGLPRDMLPKIDAEVSYTVDRISGPDLALTDLDLHARLQDGLPWLELNGGGEYQSTPVELDVRAGRADAASDARAYPIKASIKAADTTIRVDGAIGKPDSLDGLDLEVQVVSQDISGALALADITLPRIPPLMISGHVIQDGQMWRIADFYGQFSDTDVAGLIEIDLSDKRPFITADLRSNRLLFSDLMAAGDKGAAIEDRLSAARPSKTEEQPAVISVRGINFEALPEIDADVSFRGDFVEVPEFQFDQLSIDLKLRDRIAVLDASGGGDFRNGPITFEAHAGTDMSLEQPDAPYPLDLRIETEKTLVAVNGTVAKPGQAAGLQVDVALEGPNLDRLGEILQLSLPTTPPFKLQSHLAHDENRWQLTALNGAIGDSDIQGDATIVLGGERPTLEAELTSRKLDFDDLGLLIGAPTAAADDETLSVRQEQAAAREAAEPGVLPDARFDVPELRAMDARVSYRAERVQARNLPLAGVVIELALEDGQLRLEPLRFDLADGRLDSVIRLDGRSDTLAGDFELNLRQIRLNRLLSGFDIEIEGIEMEKEGIGTVGGRAQLAVRGSSIQELAGSANGKVAIIMDGGQINALIVEGIGLDIGEAIGLLLTGDEEEQAEMVPLQCFVGRFDVQDGIMRTEALVLETSDSTITGKGQIDLGAETLALELLAHPKDASALSASTPVRIEGTFEEPTIDPVSEELKEKSLAALALGVVLPVIGAIFPFFEEGETEDTNCARLIAEAEAALPAAAASGKPD